MGDTTKRNDLKGRVALVVGASRGIGRAIALRLARDGADVAAAARTLPDLETVCEEIRAAGSRAVAIEADVCKQANVEAMVAKTLEAFGQVDILVYNSGVLWVSSVAETTDEIWEKTLDVNLVGAARTVREVLNQGRMLERKQGRIIFVASEAGKVGELGLGAYAASKHGMLGLIRCLGLELGPEGITANAVCPGLIHTEMAENVVREVGKMYGAPEDNAARLEWAKDFDPQKRVAVPEDAAAVVAYLASDDAGAMTGQALNMATKIV